MVPDATREDWQERRNGIPFAGASLLRSLDDMAASGAVARSSAAIDVEGGRNEVPL